MQAVYLMLAWGAAAASPALADTYYSTCAVGFSGVLFALKVCKWQLYIVCVCVCICLCDGAECECACAIAHLHGYLELTCKKKIT